MVNTLTDKRKRCHLWERIYSFYVILKHSIIYSIVACAILTSGCRKYSFELANGYIWKYNYTNSSSVIVNSKDEIIIDTVSIELWAKYPWIYGNGELQKPFFAINMDSGQAIYMDTDEFRNFRKKHNISDDMHLLATFGDVTVKRDTSGRINTRGDELKKACMPNK